MTQKVVRINEQLQATKSREGEYLAFAFLEKDNGMKFEIVGWAQLHFRSDEPVMHLREHEVPVKDPNGILKRNGTEEIPETSCIVVFEYSKPYEHYLAILVEDITAVMTIAEKDPLTAIVSQTTSTEESGAENIEYHLIATDIEN